jgi:hypothetical protein
MKYIVQGHQLAAASPACSFVKMLLQEKPVLDLQTHSIGEYDILLITLLIDHVDERRPSYQAEELMFLREAEND